MNIRILLFFSLLAILDPAKAQEDAGTLEASLSKAIKEKRMADAEAFCEKILSRDVVADFLESGPDAAKEAMSYLALTDRLDLRMEKWRAELAENPKSERLNFLLFAASLRFDACRVKGSRRMGMLPPTHLRIRREGSRFISEAWSPKGRWEEYDSITIAMPRKALAGFVASGVTAKFEKAAFSAGGVQLPGEPLKQAQIGRSITHGELRPSGDSFSIKGAGFPIDGEQFNDDIFFCYREVEGDIVLECTVADLKGVNDLTSAGIMIRGSLNPGAPFISLSQWSNSLGRFHRVEQSDAVQYFTAFCASRPADPAFVTACLREMMRLRMNGAAREAADRLLASKPDLAALDEELFSEIYWRSGEPSALLKQRLSGPPPANPAERVQRAEDLVQQARELQEKENHELAFETWKQARELLAGKTLPFEEHRQMMISLIKTNRQDDLKNELRLFFLGTGQEDLSGPPSERMVGSVNLGDPCLAPGFMPMFYTAAKTGVAVEIAKKLEATKGNERRKGSAQAVAAALRIAAEDPACLSRIRAGGTAYIKSLAPAISPRGLALLAFQLQQTEWGRPMAVQILSTLISAKAGSREGLSLFDLLQWKRRLKTLMGQPPDKAELRELIAAAEAEKTNEESKAGVMRLLLEAGEIAEAEKLAGTFKRPISPSPFEERSDAATLLELYQSKKMPLPAIWASLADEGVQVNWEFAPNNWLFNERFVRARGAGINTLDGKYTLSIFADKGALHWSTRPDAEDLIVKLPAVGSRGVWKGAIPADMNWLVAVLEDEAGNREQSPPVPVVRGPNLLSPLEASQISSRTGDWTTPVNWYWAAGLPGGFPANALWVSRLQPDMGAIMILHKPIRIEPNASYVFQGWIRTDSGNGSRNRASLGFSFLDADGKEIDHFWDTASIAGRWTLVTGRFAPRDRSRGGSIPPNAVAIQPFLRIVEQGEFGDVGLFRVDQ